MTFFMSGKYVARGSRVAQNGKTYYSVALLQGTEPVQLGCSESVYKELDSYSEMDNIICRFTENISNGRNGAFISRYCVALGEGDNV